MSNIPSSPEDRKRIRTALQEMSDSMTRIEAERDLMKEIITNVHEEFELSKKTFRRMAKVYRRETPNYPSHDSGVGVAAKKTVNVYTGDQVMGISIVHKSCLQPVFSGDQAKDFASMRR